MWNYDSFLGKPDGTVEIKVHSTITLETLHVWQSDFLTKNPSLDLISINKFQTRLEPIPLFDVTQFYPVSTSFHPRVTQLYHHQTQFHPCLTPTLPLRIHPFYSFLSDGQSYITLLISIWDRRWSNTNVEEDIKYVSYYVLDSQSNQFNKEIISKYLLPVSLPVPLSHIRLLS